MTSMSVFPYLLQTFYCSKYLKSKLLINCIFSPRQPRNRVRGHIKIRLRYPTDENWASAPPSGEDPIGPPVEEAGKIWLMKKILV